MKLLMVFFLTVVISAGVQAQNRSMADATYALKGQVRSFKTEVAEFVLKGGDYVEGPRVLQMEALFNQDGNRTDLHLYNDKGELTRRIVMKFDGRKMTEAMNYDGAGKLWLRIVNVYDEYGRLKEEVTYNADGSVHSRKTFKRDELGQAYEVSEYNARGVLLDQFKNSFDGPLLLSTERKIYGEDGSLQSVHLYEAEKKRSETTSYRPDGSVANKTVRVDQQVETYGPDGALQKTTTVSRENRLLDEVILNKDGSTTRHSQIPDQVDAHGNWTKQTKWQTDAKGMRPLQVVYRAINYY